MCSRTSSSKASSSRPCSACPFTRAHSIRRFRIASPLPLEPQHALHDPRYPLPVLCLAPKLLRALSRNRVEAGPPIVLACPPGRRDPPLLLQPQQRRVHRSFVKIEYPFAHLLDSPRYPETVQRPHCKKRLQYHQIQGALHHVRLPVALHCTLLWTLQRSYHTYLWNVQWKACPAPRGADPS